MKFAIECESCQSEAPLKVGQNNPNWCQFCLWVIRALTNGHKKITNSEHFFFVPVEEMQRGFLTGKCHI